MRAVIQRVRNASVVVDGKTTGSIDRGLLVYLGIAPWDTEEICAKLAAKISKLRIFRDEQEKMNLSVSDIGGNIIVVSQFTLYANIRKGNRPSFDGACEPVLADHLYEVFLEEVRRLGFDVQHGLFAADMHVRYENDGPITIIADSEELFG